MDQKWTKNWSISKMDYLYKYIVLSVLVLTFFYVFICAQMRFMLLFSRQGKLRLQKWYTATAERDKKKMVRELMQIVLARKPKMCSFLEWRDLKIVYKR